MTISEYYTSNEIIKVKYSARENASSCTISFNQCSCNIRFSQDSAKRKKMMETTQKKTESPHSFISPPHPKLIVGT